METFYQVDADQIEQGDQILVYGDPLEVTKIMDDPDDDSQLIICGLSYNTGDIERYPVKFNERFEVWGV